MWALCRVDERSPGFGKARLLDPSANFSCAHTNLCLTPLSSWCESGWAVRRGSIHQLYRVVLCLVLFKWGSVVHTTVSCCDTLLRELDCSILHEHLRGCNSLQGSSCSFHGTQWLAWLGTSCLEHFGDSSFVPQGDPINRCRVTVKGLFCGVLLAAALAAQGLGCQRGIHPAKPSFSSYFRGIQVQLPEAEPMDSELQRFNCCELCPDFGTPPSVSKGFWCIT